MLFFNKVSGKDNLLNLGSPFINLSNLRITHKKRVYDKDSIIFYKSILSYIGKLASDRSILKSINKTIIPYRPHELIYGVYFYSSGYDNNLAHR